MLVLLALIVAVSAAAIGLFSLIPGWFPLERPEPQNGTVDNNAFYDSFDNEYTLTDEVSPNGKWRAEFIGGGAMGVRASGVFFEDPALPDESNATRSSLALSQEEGNNPKGSLLFRTVDQNKASPNEWEVAWTMLKYVDDTHHYYFVLKTNGWELGKKDNPPGENAPENQRFLATGPAPSAVLGTWYKMDYEVVGDRIKVWIDNDLVVDFTDDGTSSDGNGLINAQTEILAGPGSIGLYNEDAEVEFDNVVFR